MFKRWYGDKDHHEQDSTEKQTKINELKAAIGPLSGHSLLFCSDACLRRYLEARNWNIQKSKKMLEETLKWRAAYKPEKIRWVNEKGHGVIIEESETIGDQRARVRIIHTLVLAFDNQVVVLLLSKKRTSIAENPKSFCRFTKGFPAFEVLYLDKSRTTNGLWWTKTKDEVAVEGETGKMFRANYLDRFGRSVLLMKPGNQNTTSQDNQLRHLVYLLENAIMNLPPGQEQMVWLIDFNGWSLSNSVPIKTARETANILQNHYPERLAVGFLYNPPRIFETFWKIVKYFLDPKTSQKVKFVYPKSGESASLLEEVFDMDKLQSSFGGKNNHQYDHAEFSKLMHQDDVKTAEYWAIGDEVTEMNGNSASSDDLKVDGNGTAQS